VSDRHEADGIEGTWQPARLRLNVVHLLGTNDHDGYALRVVRRVSRRHGRPERTSVPGITAFR
jgi:hypothetical protein